MTPGTRRQGQSALALAPHVELHIEELVLHGFAPGDRYRIGEAVQAELARLFAEQGVPGALMAGGAVGRLDAGAIQVAPGARVEAIGIHVAQAVYGSMGGNVGERAGHARASGDRSGGSGQ